VYHNLAVSMLYRRAVSLAYGITMTEGNDEPENMNEQAVARMSDLLELERRMMQFIHVYDVNKVNREKQKKKFFLKKTLCYNSSWSITGYRAKVQRTRSSMKRRRRSFTSRN